MLYLFGIFDARFFLFFSLGIHKQSRLYSCSQKREAGINIRAASPHQGASG